MTNFDLSTYIRWLKPGTQTPSAFQEPQTHRELTITPFNNSCLAEESGPHFLNYNNSMVEETRFPQKQEVFETQFPFSPSKKTSPTAVGLLFQSSIFRDLVQKNLNGSDEEDDAEDKKIQPQMVNDDEYTGLFYETDDTLNNFPFMISPNYKL